MKTRRGARRLRLPLLALAALLLVGMFTIVSRPSFDMRAFARDPIGTLSRTNAWVQAKSLAVFDLSSDEMLEFKEPELQVAPASLAKLFVIDYAATLVAPTDIVQVAAPVFDLVKPESSTAGLTPGSYTVANLYAAMLVPSGNDAAYALANHIGALLDPAATDVQSRHQAFLTGLATHLAQRGYSATAIHDAAGYDSSSTTTAVDIKRVVSVLLTYDWFRDIVSQAHYTATTPSGVSYTWQNTNMFLQEGSPYFHPAVRGIKTGSLADNYHLVTLYQAGERSFLVIVLGAISDEQRYEEVSSILGSLDETAWG